MIENVVNLVLLSPPGVSYGVGDTPGVSYRVSHTGCVCLYGAKSHSWKVTQDFAGFGVPGKENDTKPPANAPPAVH